MPYFGEPQQQPQQQQWGQPPQQQWVEQQQQWGQPQQQQWGQAQPQQQQWQPQQKMAQGGPQAGGQQQSFSPVQQQQGPVEIGGPGGTDFYLDQMAQFPPVSQPSPEPAPIGPDTSGFPGIGGGPPGMPGISPELQSFLDGLSSKYQPQPGGGNPLIQMLMMMLMGGGGGGMPGPGMPPITDQGPDNIGPYPDQGEPPKPKTRGVPGSWGSPPPVPDGDYPVSADIPGFGMFNGPVTIFNWIRENIAAHGPMDEPGPEPGPEPGGGPGTGGGFQDWLDSNPGGLEEHGSQPLPWMSQHPDHEKYMAGVKKKHPGYLPFGGAVESPPLGEMTTMAIEQWRNKYSGEVHQVGSGGYKPRPGDHGWERVGGQQQGGGVTTETGDPFAGMEMNPDGTPKGHMHIQAHPNIDHSKPNTSHSPPGWAGGQ